MRLKESGLYRFLKKIKLTSLVLFCVERSNDLLRYWYYCMLVLAKINCRIINDIPNIFPPLLNRTQSTGLARINLDMDQNTVQFKKVFDYYDLYKYID